MEERKKLYPKIVNANLVEPLEPSAPISPDNFRLEHITKIQKELQDELNNYSRCRRKYNSAFNAVSNIHSAAGVGTIATSGTGLGLIVSGIGAPAGIALASVSVTCGIGSLMADFVLRKINKKLKKHIAISQLANSKITSVQKLISTALEDCNISDSDFKKIVDDYENYQSQKQNIQSKMMTTPTDIGNLKKHFLEQGRKLGIEEAKNYLLEKSK